MDRVFGAVFTIVLPIVIVAALAVYLKLDLWLALVLIAAFIAVKMLFDAMAGRRNQGFERFNRFFGKTSRDYSAAVTGALGRKPLVLVAYVLLLGLAWLGFGAVPPGFVPVQDKQYLVGFAQLPQGATLDRTEQVMREMSDIMMKEPGLDHAIAFPGLSINGFIKFVQRGHRLRRAEAVRGAAVARFIRPGDRAGSADEIHGHQGRLSSPSSRRRPSRASARSAASSCRWRIAPTRAMPRSTRR